jgi:hypothetical protein
MLTKSSDCSSVYIKKEHSTITSCENSEKYTKTFLNYEHQVRRACRSTASTHTLRLFPRACNREDQDHGGR